MWKRIKMIGPSVLGLALAAVLALTWSAAAQPSAIIADVEQAFPRALSSDGRWLLVQQQGKDALLRLPAGPRVELDSHFQWSWLQRYDFSPDGKFFVGQQKNRWQLWNLETGAAPRELCNVADNQQTVRFSPDSQKLAVVAQAGGSVPVQIWDANQGSRQAIGTTDAFFDRVKASWINCWEWGHGQTILGEEYKGNRVSCWDVPQSRVRFRIEHLAASYGISRPTWRVSLDGKRCVAIVSHEPQPPKSVPQKPLVQAWDIATGKLLWERPIPVNYAMFDLSFMPDSRHVAISSRDLARNYLVVLQLWNVEDGVARTLSEASGDEAFHLTATGRFLQHAKGWWEVHENEARPAIGFDDDGHWYDREGAKHAMLSRAEKANGGARGEAYMARVGGDGYVGAAGIMADLSPDDRWLAMRLTFDHRRSSWMDLMSKVLPGSLAGPSTGRDYELHLIDLQDGAPAPVLHDAENWLFSRDGRILITAGASEVRLWTLPLSVPTWHRWALGLMVLALFGMQGWIWRRAR